MEIEREGEIFKKKYGESPTQSSRRGCSIQRIEGYGGVGFISAVLDEATWFKRQGYKKADKNRVAPLLWKPFSKEAIPPR